MRLLALSLLNAGVASAASHSEATPVDLCQALRTPSKFAGKLIVVDGFLVPLMHGTYLKEAGCDESILLVLPAEIPHYKGGISVVQDAQFERFLDARANHRPDATVFFAEFTGKLEYARRGKGFGYYKNQRTRLVLQAVSHVRTGPSGGRIGGADWDSLNLHICDLLREAQSAPSFFSLSSAFADDAADGVIGCVVAMLVPQLVSGTGLRCVNPVAKSWSWATGRV
jgi:hypothetical protein